MSAGFAFLSTERLYLRPLLLTDVQGTYPQWFNDEDVGAANTHHVFPFTPSDAEAYIRALHASRNAIVLAIVLREGDRHIGNTSLQNIEWVHRSADFAIVIGDKGVWNQGYATECARLMFHHGFSTLNLHRIAFGTFDNNEAVKRFAINLGMKEEGCRREAVYKNGRYLDVVEYGVFQAEFEATQGGGNK